MAETDYFDGGTQGMENNAESEVLTAKYLIFQLDELLFGVDAEFVTEIITNHAVTPLPVVPAFIRGIINLRGQIIPILDMRVVFEKQPGESTCMIVLSIEGIQLGILVDSVAQMIDVPIQSVLPMPTHNKQKLTSGICTLPDKNETFMVIDGNLLLSL